MQLPIYFIDYCFSVHKNYTESDWQVLPDCVFDVVESKMMNWS